MSVATFTVEPSTVRSAVLPKRAVKKATTKSKAIEPMKVVKKTTKAKTAPAKVVKTSAAKVVKKTTKTTANVKPRKGFFLTPEDVEQYRAEFKETKAIPIPHNNGAYRAFIRSLLNLGKDKSHSFAAVKGEMRAGMSHPDTRDDEKRTAWQRFIGKESHSEENAKNLDGKIHQNAEVLQRVSTTSETPYGLRLMQVGTMVLKSKGMTIDILRGKGDERMYRLNTNSAAPLNEFRRQRKGE